MRREENLNSIVVVVTPDQMQAKLVIPQRRPVFGRDDVRRLLERQRVVYGLNHEFIDWLCKSPTSGNEFVIANGSPAKPAQHAWIEYKFEVQLAAELASLKIVHPDSIFNVHAGDVLAILHPAEPGKPGRNVRGEVLMPDAPLDRVLPMGENTAYENDSKTTLVATCSGAVKVDSAGLISVLPVLDLHYGIDHVTGDFTFAGDIILTGDLKANHAVTCEGKFEIRGTAEDAKITAGEVLIKGGFTGRGLGVCKVERNFSAQFVLNQSVTAGGSILIAGEARNARLQAGESIHITGSKGFVIGGELIAGKEIIAEVLGNSLEVPTKVGVGASKEIFEQIALVQDAVSNAVGRYEAVKMQAGFPSDFNPQIENPGFSPSSPMGRAYKQIQLLYQKAVDLQTKLNELQVQATEYATNCTIRVTKSCFPSVEIRFGSKAYIVKHPLGPTVFRLTADGITHGPV